MRRRALLLLLLASGGCSILTDSFEIDTFSGDPFPIDVDTTTGAILVGLRDGTVDRTAVLDIMSPVTIEDSGAGSTPLVDNPQLDLLGEDPAGALAVPRAHFDGPQVIHMHPCNDEACTVGDDASTRGYSALVGGNSLAGDDLRLALGSNSVFILPNVAGDTAHRSEICDAVYPSPFRGGGTMIIEGTELPFSSFRPTLQTCLAPDPDPAKLQSQRGTDALFVASTSLGVTLLATSAYERYRAEQLLATGISPPDVAALPADSVTLPGGAVGGHATTIPSFALVAASNGASQPRSPCRQVYASHLLEPADCDDNPTTDCPCSPPGEQPRFCPVPAVTELAPPTGLAVLVVDDDEPVLQALRTELSPDQPDIDGILGTQAMLAPTIDADYPHNRILMRCAPHTPGCVVRPEFDDEDFRPQFQGCVGDRSSGSGSGGPIE
nr:hypothetical protein [Kofleriaceae bacterium]